MKAKNDRPWHDADPIALMALALMPIAQVTAILPLLLANYVWLAGDEVRLSSCQRAISIGLFLLAPIALVLDVLAMLLLLKRRAAWGSLILTGFGIVGAASGCILAILIAQFFRDAPFI